MIIRSPERLPTQTLLGIRFWDAVSDRQITEGLRVTAQLLSLDRTQRVARPVTARLTRSGVYAFFGLHRGEWPAGEPLLWEGAPPARRAVVDVEDPLGRYQATSFEVEVPFRGPFRGEGAWLSRPLMLPLPAAGQGRGVHLWPAAGQGVPAGFTALYGNVVVGEGDTPPAAKFAVVEVLSARTNGALVPHAYGITDAAGRLTLPLPYPTVPQPAGNAPYPALRNQRFDLTIRILYQPAVISYLPGSSVPDLSTILGQAQAQIVRRYQPGQTPALILAPDLIARLSFGEPFVLRTQTADPARPEAFLRIQP